MFVFSFLFSRHAAWIRHLQTSSIKVQIFSKFWWKWKHRDYSNCHELKGALTWAGLQRTSRKFPADPQLPWVPAEQWDWCFATWVTHRSSLLSMRIGPRGCGGAPTWRLMQRITTPLTQCCGEEDKHCFNLKVDAENYNTFNTMLWRRR